MLYDFEILPQNWLFISKLWLFLSVLYPIFYRLTCFMSVSCSCVGFCFTVVVALVVFLQTLWSWFLLLVFCMNELTLFLAAASVSDVLKSLGVSEFPVWVFGVKITDQVYETDAAASDQQQEKRSWKKKLLVSVFLEKQRKKKKTDVWVCSCCFCSSKNQKRGEKPESFWDQEKKPRHGEKQRSCRKFLQCSFCCFSCCFQMNR